MVIISQACQARCLCRSLADHTVQHHQQGFHYKGQCWALEPNKTFYYGVCVCVECTPMYGNEHTRSRVWKPGGCQVSCSRTLCPISLTEYLRQAGRAQDRDPSLFASRSPGVTGMWPVRLLTWVLGSKPRSSCLDSKHSDLPRQLFSLQTQTFIIGSANLFLFKFWILCYIFKSPAHSRLKYAPMYSSEIVMFHILHVNLWGI